MEIKKLIVPTTLDNTNEDEDEDDISFRTQDLIYLDTMSDINEMDREERVCYPTDYAIMNDAIMSDSYDYGIEDRKSCWTWLRLRYVYNDYVVCVNYKGEISGDYVDNNNVSIRPTMQLNLPAVISAKRKLANVIKMGVYKVDNEIIYHTIEIGEYPKTYVGDALNEKLEKELSNGTLSPTGKKYTGYIDEDGSLNYNEEYIFRGQKYVRVESSVINDDDSEFLDGTTPQNRTSLWAKVEPITWIIRNWDEMPKEINPKGSGTAKTMVIQTYEAIISGIPFYTNNKDNNCTFWQNSPIRAYLNGYDIYEELNNGNGNVNYKADKNFDFKNNNFLNEAFNQKVLVDLPSIQNEQNCSNTDKSQRPLSPAEIARNELIKKALERRKQAQQSNNSNDQNENVL